MMRERVNKLNDEHTIWLLPDEIVVSAESHQCEIYKSVSSFKVGIKKSLRMIYQ